MFNYYFLYSTSEKSHFSGARFATVSMGPTYLVFGLSILLYSKQWQSLLKGWQKDHFALFTMFFFYIILGLISIGIYNVWEWNVELLVTITGWGLLLKGVFYFLAPASVIKSSFSLTENKSLLFLGGVVSVIIGGALSHLAYFA